MDKKKIGILFGGCSPEYEVSLESAYSVITSIQQEKYEVALIGITKDGDWYKYEGDVENIKQNQWREKGKCTKIVISNNKKDRGLIEISQNGTKLLKLDAIFPVLHGQNGEDGTVQGLIELSGIPLIGCGVLSSSLCMDKYTSHKLVESYGIKVAKSIVINDKTTIEERDNRIKTLKYPLFIKPMRAGSSFGITKIDSKKELDSAIQTALKYDTEIIIEENVDGIEVGCAILGKEELIVGEVDEIELSKGFFDYTEKYTLKTSQIHCPARIGIEKQKEIKQVAQKIYKILKCKDFARVDMFLDKEGNVYFNEINTIPGFTAHSRYPNMMKQIGISFEELVQRLIDMEV